MFNTDNNLNGKCFTIQEITNKTLKTYKFASMNVVFALEVVGVQFLIVQTLNLDCGVE